jgi:hypothetical protein
VLILLFCTGFCLIATLRSCHVSTEGSSLLVTPLLNTTFSLIARNKNSGSLNSTWKTPVKLKSSRNRLDTKRTLTCLLDNGVCQCHLDFFSRLQSQTFKMCTTSDQQFMPSRAYLLSPRTSQPWVHSFPTASPPFRIAVEIQSSSYAVLDYLS